MLETTLLGNESTVRLGVFLAILFVMALWEFAAPRRRLEIPRLIRWTNNLALVFIDTLLVRLVFPILAVGLAIETQTQGWGLLNILEVPHWLAILISIVALDLAIYGQHVLFHHVPFLWRLHRVHHADLDFDFTTGLRFHPLEIVLSMAIKLLVVFILGPPAIAVLVFEVLLNGCAIFNHSNAKLPLALDKIIRLFLVTPDMHRVHHSVHKEETNSNYGFSVPWWDWVFGTYNAQPKDNHTDMKIGIELFRNSRELWLDRLLVQPFLRVRKDVAKTENNSDKPAS